MTRRFGLPAITAACLALVAAASAEAGKPPKNDSVAPSVSITAPASGATVAGTITVSGTASDNAALSAVAVKVDGGAYRNATGTTSWSLTLDSSAYADGSHTITARAVDKSGNASLANLAVSIANATPTPPPPPPPPPVDTAPTIAFTAPAAGATVTGTVAVTGSATDDVSVARVEVAVDGGAWSSATGTAGWDWSWNSAAVSNGTHTLAARAFDSAGNSTTATRTVAVSNTSTAPTVREQLITPEGAKILVYSDVVGWTAQQVYDLLKPNAYELDTIGPTLTVKVQTTNASQTSTSAGATDGVYDYFRATISLQAKAGSTFASRPDQIVAHEYGHAWTMYHLYMTRQADWGPWLSARGLAGDSRVDSSYNWSKNEMIADDYRMLFGTAAAVSQAAYINASATDPRLVPGLREFFVSSWSQP